MVGEVEKAQAHPHEGAAEQAKVGKEEVASAAGEPAQIGPAESPWRNAWTKATFLGFCWLSFLLFAAIGGLTYYLVHPRLTEIHPWLDWTVLAGVVLFFSILGGGLFLISVTALTGIDLLYPHNKGSVTVRMLFPIAATLSQLLGVDRNKLRTSFVKVNNVLTKAQLKRIRGDRLLFLLPHCLQIDVCNRKITNHPLNCRRCGGCPVGSLLDLGDKYGLKVEVVNGGTLARRKVVSFRPTAIIAVACERDLTLGIQDVHPVPVYGVINDRPNGPCYNTCVDLGFVEQAVRVFKERHAKKSERETVSDE
jgi:hypothetical protein